MNMAFSAASLPESLNSREISFVSMWKRDVINLTAWCEDGKRSYLFGYFYDGGENEIVSRVCAVVEDKHAFPLETRSMIWRIAEIKVERHNEWLVLWRQQNDLSSEALADFLIDSTNFLEHLRDEFRRINPA